MTITGRQINALAELIEQAEGQYNNDIPTPEEMAKYMLTHGAYMLPCIIGQKAWIIRKYNGVAKAVASTVSEMYFIDDMRLVICVRNYGRGEWGKRVFATKDECEEAKKNVYN